MFCYPKPLLFTVLALLLGIPSVAPAQSAAFQGTFTYHPQSSDDIEQAIQRSVARMNFAVRPIARSRLRRTNEPYRTITIAHTPSQISVTTDGASTVTAPADGTPIRWRRQDGEQLQVSTVWEGGNLKQLFVADDGQRENLYSLSPDGNTLTMRVTLTSSRLPEPITYNLRFRRTS